MKPSCFGGKTLNRTPEPNHPGTTLDARPFLPALLLLFFGSGCAALIYEIVWFQLLQLVIGSSAVSLGVLLGTFMGGMCLGSLALSRVVPASLNPLRVYAAIELAIGILGVRVLSLVPQAGRLYAANAVHGFAGILFRGLVCGVCLAPPTLLMGATLPAISRWIETSPEGVSWLGFFYAGNIAGAVFGCLTAGFYLLRVHDMAFATYTAAAVNVAVAATGFGLAAFASRPAPRLPTRNEPRHPVPGAWRVYLAIGISGACALAAEVVWTRILSLMLGATVYTFSIILAVFLIGLGLGSSMGSLLARRTSSQRDALGACQVLLTAAIAWSAYALSNSLPYWPINPSLAHSPWLSFQVDLVRCAWAILPAACLWGASFPLALASVASPGQDPGRLVGRVYAANTVGAIIGALGCSILLIGWVGSRDTQRLLIGLSALAALLVFVPAVRQPAADVSSRIQSGPPPSKTTRLVLLAGSVVCAALLAWSVPQVPWQLVAHGRFLPTKSNPGKLLYVGEGMNASVAVTEFDAVRYFHVSGKVEASSDSRDMRLQRMLGHIPAMLHPDPRSVLVVGCGAGVTAGSFLLYPEIGKIVICEIEPLIPQAVARFFAKQNYNVVHDPRVKIVYDDARHYVLTTPDKFDIITSDPIHPWVKGAATLYTKEYFEMCKRHLNPGGLVTQWVPLYESNFEVVKSEIATFFDVFPHGTIWSNDDNGAGYDIVLLGQEGEMKINVDDLQHRLEGKDRQAVGVSLRDVGFKSAVDLLGTYAGQSSDLWPWLQRAELNLDRNLRLQYLAGMQSAIYDEEMIFFDMSAYRKFPEDLFVVSNERRPALRKAIDRR